MKKIIFLLTMMFICIASSIHAQTSAHIFKKYDPSKHSNLQQKVVRGDWSINESNGILTVTETQGIKVQQILSTAIIEKYILAVDNCGNLHIITPIGSKNNSRDPIASIVSANDPDRGSEEPQTAITQKVVSK